MATIRKFSRYVDGYYGTPVLISRTPREYPFAALGNTTAARYVATYLVEQSLFTPTARGTVDPDNSGFYLESETKPEIFQGDIATFQRTYASVPADVVSYGTRVITRPSPSNVGSTSLAFRSFPSDVVTVLAASFVYNSYFFGGDNKIYGALRSVTPTVTVATGGTFTVTYKTSTTAALNYNETTGNIAAAINALADVITDGLTVVVTGNFTAASFTIQLTAGSTSTKFSINGASLNPATSRTVYVFLSSSTQQLVSVGYRIALTAHGLSAADLLVTNLVGGVTTGYLLANSTNWAILDANNIVANLALFSGPTSVTIGQYYRAYTPGSARVGLRRTQKFYLPGVTVGITTPADIPLPALLLNDAELLASVLANLTGYQTYDASELTRWNDGPIYTQTHEEIDMATL